MANTHVKWCVDWEIVDVLDAWIPPHYDTCKPRNISLDEVGFVTLNTCCNLCMEEFEELCSKKRDEVKKLYHIRDPCYHHPCREDFEGFSFPSPQVIKLTFQERIPIFHKLEPIDFVNVGFFKGCLEEQIMEIFQGYKSFGDGMLHLVLFAMFDIGAVWNIMKILKDGVPNMSPSAQQSLMSMFGNVDECMSSFRTMHLCRKLKDFVLNMSPSAHQSWMSMFGNVDKSISSFNAMLWCGKFHLFAHQMAYFLSTLDAEDKARFLQEVQINNFAYTQDLHNLCMLIPCMGLDTIERILEKDYPKSILAAFCLFTVRKQRDSKLSLVFTQDHVGQLACRFGLPYISSNSSPITFSLNVICPLKIMNITPFIKSSGRGIPLLEMEYQQVCVSAQLKYKIELQPHSIQVSMCISNVRCHVAFFARAENPWGAEFGKETHFPSKIQIRVEPSEECKMGTQSLTIGKSSNDASRTVSQEDQWEAGIQFPKGPAELKTGKKVGSSSEHSNWRFEMDECSGNFNVGYFDWTLFDNANGVEVWNADSKNYKKLLNPKSSLRNRGNHMSSPFNSNGGCVFGEDLYGNPLTWSLDRKLEGTTSLWTVHADVWLTYCFNNTYNSCYQSVYSSFTETLEMKLQ